MSAPAFPVDYNNQHVLYTSDAKEFKRQHYAAAAMQGQLSAMDSGERNYCNPEVLAQNSFMFADAMIRFEENEQ